MDSFNYYSPTEFVFGDGRESEVGALAKKYGAKEFYTIEHNIRNAIDSAYISPGRQKLTKNNIMSGFESRPSNKEFILAASQKVQSLLAETVMNN